MRSGKSSKFSSLSWISRAILLFNALSFPYLKIFTWDLYSHSPPPSILCRPCFLIPVANLDCGQGRVIFQNIPMSWQLFSNIYAAKILSSWTTNFSSYEIQEEKSCKAGGQTQEFGLDLCLDFLFFHFFYSNSHSAMPQRFSALWWERLQWQEVTRRE